MITEHGFGTGGVKENRNEMVASFSEVVADSPTFDWNKGFDIRQALGKDISLKNQGQSGSCGGQSSSYLTEAILNSSEQSARSIYSKCFVPGGGSAESGLMSTILFNGVAQEQIVSSYENGNPPSETFMETAYSEPTNIVKGLRAVYVSLDFDSIATALLQNKGVVIGISGQNNGTWLSADPVAPNLPSGDASLWHHWVYIGFAGVRNGKRVLGLKNSWGSVGENGWQYLGETWLPYIWCAWSMIYQTSSKPIYTFTTPLTFGQSSKDIVALQDILRYEGFFNNASTGFYGNLTAQAVYNFQMKYKVDTIPHLDQLQGKRVGSLTISKLNNLYGQKS